MSIPHRTIAGISVLLFVALAVLATAGCISPDTLPGSVGLGNNDISWYNYDIVDSSLYDTVNHTFNPKDNFYAYANEDEIKINAERGYAGTSRAIEIRGDIDAMFDRLSQNTSITGTEAELVRTVNTMYHNIHKRDALGVRPVLPAVSEIRNVSTLDELSALISSGGVSSLKEAFVREVATTSPFDGCLTVLAIVPQEFALIDSGMYLDMALEYTRLYAYLMNNFQTFLERCGYATNEAKATVTAFMDFETALALGCDNQVDLDVNNYTKSYHPYTYDQLSEMAFPIAGDLKVYHDAGVTQYTVDDPAWLNTLNELYTQENIEWFKAAMLYNLFMTATPFLDKKTQKMYFNNGLLTFYWSLVQVSAQRMAELDEKLTPFEDVFEKRDSIRYDNTSPKKVVNVTEVRQSYLPESLLSTYVSNEARSFIKNEYIGMALGKVIADAYIPAGKKEEYTNLIHEIVAVFKERLMNADWLSNSTRSAALDKLSKIKVRVFYPDDWSYYSYDDVDYKNAETLYNLSVQLRKHNQAEVVKDALQNPSAAVWIKDAMKQNYRLPQTYNAFYTPDDNSITILYGYLFPLLVNASVTDEEVLAVAGTTIAHEITHGFDPSGSKFDGNGTLVNWWSDIDRKNYKAKEKMIAEYFSSFEARPGEYLNGAIETGEIIADLGGLSVILDIARTKEDFDYDQFFTTYAQSFYCPSSDIDYALYLADVHPPGMYRVNGGVQQYDDFINTYNITEGDQMYLAPENRLTIW